MHAPLIYVGGKLSTKRMLLEALTPAHAPLMIDGFADASLYRWIDVNPPADSDELKLRLPATEFTYPFSALGWAALALPPYVQLAARPGGDGLVLAAGKLLASLM